jgi:hypothetical protein
MTAPLQFWNELAQGPLGSNWEHMGTHWLRGYAGRKNPAWSFGARGLVGTFCWPLWEFHLISLWCTHFHRCFFRWFCVVVFLHLAPCSGVQTRTNTLVGTQRRNHAKPACNRQGSKYCPGRLPATKGGAECNGMIHILVIMAISSMIYIKQSQKGRCTMNL